MFCVCLHVFYTSRIVAEGWLQIKRCIPDANGIYICFNMQQTTGILQMSSPVITTSNYCLDTLLCVASCSGLKKLNHLLRVQVVPVGQWDQVSLPYPRYKDKRILSVNWTFFFAQVYLMHHVAKTCTSSPLGPCVPWFPGRPLSPFSPGSPGGPIRPINPPWPCRQRHGSSPLFPRV